MPETRIFWLRRVFRSGTRPFALLVTLAVSFGASQGWASPAPLPGGTVEVATNRFRSPLSYRATMQWLEKSQRGRGNRLNFETLVDLPDVVAAHAPSKLATTTWSGVNISEFEGAVWIFFIAR